MSGSIGKGATGIIDQIIVFLTFRQELQNVYFDNITFSAKSEQQVVVQPLHYQWILNLQQLLLVL
jgi:hypothetical protein